MEYNNVLFDQNSKEPKFLSQKGKEKSVKGKKRNRF